MTSKAHIVMECSVKLILHHGFDLVLLHKLCRMKKRKKKEWGDVKVGKSSIFNRLLLHQQVQHTRL